MRRRVGSEGGVALVIVLIVLALLLTVAGEFVLAMRLEGSTTLNFRAAVAGAYLAEAGYHRALVEIAPEAIAHHLDEKGDLIFRRSRTEVAPAPDRTEIKLGPGRFSYRITDEESRLSLNRATPEQLHRLLQELGLEKEARDVVVDSIQDWRDPNDEHRLNGAESDYYLGLPVPYKAKNADFDSVEELLQVRGVTPQLFYGTPDHPGLVEYLTTAGNGQINVNTASDVVLKTLGYAQAEVDLIRGSRPYLDLQALPPAMRRPNVALTSRATTFRIEAWGELPGQGRRTLLALVQRLSGRRDTGLPVTVRSWQWLDEERTRP
jgi:general secretion pathway protein K